MRRPRWIISNRHESTPVCVLALAGAGLTTAAEIVARAKELAAAAEGAVDEKEKKEEGKLIHGEVEVVVEGEVENKEDEAKGVNKEAEVEISNRHKSTPECVLKVEEGPVTGWTEQLMIEYYFQLSTATFGMPVKEWVMRDRIPNLKKEDKKKKKLLKERQVWKHCWPLVYSRAAQIRRNYRGLHSVNCIRSL